MNGPAAVIEVAGTRRAFEGMDIRSQGAERVDDVVGCIGGRADGAALYPRKFNDERKPVPVPACTPGPNLLRDEELGLDVGGDANPEYPLRQRVTLTNTPAPDADLILFQVIRPMGQEFWGCPELEGFDGTLGTGRTAGDASGRRFALPDIRRAPREFEVEDFRDGSVALRLLL